MKIKDILLWGHEVLTPVSDSARLDADILLSYVLKKPNTFLLAHNDEEIGFFSLHRYKRLIEKRKKGIPVAYLTGIKEFYGLDFKVNKNVLVPRPDTEILVNKAIEYIDKLRVKKNKLIVLDIGTGSGCIPISILKNIPGIKTVATEVSSSALRVAKYNVKKHKLKSRIRLIKTDLLKNVSSRLFKDHEVIITANLPYIPRVFKLHPSTEYEPNLALYGGGDGLDLYKRLIEQLDEIEIKPKAMFFELFEFQAAILGTKVKNYEVKFTEDMTGDARCMMMERKI